MPEMIVYLFPYFFYQLMAVAVQLFAGGNLVSLLTGIPLINAMLIMAGTVLIYSFVSGLEASIVTDFVQFILRSRCFFDRSCHSQ